MRYIIITWEDRNMPILWQGEDNLPIQFQTFDRAMAWGLEHLDKQKGLEWKVVDF